MKELGTIKDLSQGTGLTPIKKAEIKKGFELTLVTAGFMKGHLDLNKFTELVQRIEKRYKNN
jgi:hypothetical protein